MTDRKFQTQYWWVKIGPHPECALVQFYEDHIQIRRVGESEPLSLPTDKKDDVLLEPLIPAGGRARISRFMDVVSDAGSNWKKTSKELEQLTGLVDQALEFAKFMHGSMVATIAEIHADSLEKCIKTKFVPLNREMRKRMFGTYGPLNSFAAKIDIAFALGITTKFIHDELNKFRDLRNEMAHPKQLLTFEAPEVQSLVGQLSGIERDGKDAERIVLAHAEMLQEYLDAFLVRMGASEDVSAGDTH